MQEVSAEEQAELALIEQLVYEGYPINLAIMEAHKKLNPEPEPTPCLKSE